MIFYSHPHELNADYNHTDISRFASIKRMDAITAHVNIQALYHWHRKNHAHEMFDI